jgi:hypothetical protein
MSKTSAYSAWHYKCQPGRAAGPAALTVPWEPLLLWQCVVVTGETFAFLYPTICYVFPSSYFNPPVDSRLDLT